MDCPSCYHPLNEVHSHGTYLDVCANCKGIWFDSEELNEVIKLLLIDPSFSTPAAGAPSKTAANPAERKHECPRCHKVMEKFQYAYDSSISLDRCVRCRGIWADGGEVGDIVRFLKRIKPTP